NLTATDDGIPTGVTTKQFVFEVIYEASLGINNEEKNKFNVYPNPTDDILTIELENMTGFHQIQLNDLTGKMIISKEIENHEQLNLSLLNEGIYLLTILKDGEVIGIERVVKK
ncbi:MAG: T9SS type A sorting domain-containing protein, partial [Bacteroidota bacterium]